MDIQHNNLSLTGLPCEVINNIASRLEVRDLLLFCKVCVTIRKALEQYEKDLLEGKPYSSFSFTEHKVKNVLSEVKSENAIIKQYSIKLFPRDLTIMISDFLALISGRVCEKKNFKADFYAGGPTQSGTPWFIKYEATYKVKNDETLQEITFLGAAMKAEKIVIKWVNATEHTPGPIFIDKLTYTGDDKISYSASSISQTLDALI